MRHIIYLIFSLSSLSLYAQEVQSYSSIKLKDGSKLKVTVLENIPGDYIKIKLAENQETILSYADILSVRHKNYMYNSRFVLPKGFYIDGSFGLLFGQANDFGDSRMGLSLSVAANYRFNSFLSLGVGFEPTALTINSNYLMLPMYIHFTGNMIERRTSAFYSLDLGYSTASSPEADNGNIAMKGGVFFRPGIGLRFNKVTLGVAYQIQKVQTTRNYEWWWQSNQTTVEERLMRNIRVSTSIIF